MSRAERAHAVRTSAWTAGVGLQSFSATEAETTSSLADTLLAIEQRRGALFMLDMSRSLIEKWDLRCDRLQGQSEETVRLVEQLLKS
jgi:hypothetical protein